MRAQGGIPRAYSAFATDRSEWLCPVRPAADMGRIVKPTRRARTCLMQCSKRRPSANHGSLTTFAAIGFFDPGKGFRDATA